MINNLQLLRAFAALNVVLFHTLGVASLKGYDTQLFQFLKGWGASGVDIFFVISGFVMVYIQTINPKTTFEFLINRVKRIVPLYWSLTALLVVLFYFFSANFNLDQSLTSFLFVSRIFGADFPVLQQGWTLEYEMFFYLIFGFSISAKQQSTALIVSLILLPLVIFGFIDSIVIEFIFGMLAGYLYLNKRIQKYSLLFFVAGFLGLVVSFLLLSNVSRVVVFGLPSFFLVLGCCYLPQTKSSILTFLGSASYSIYLIQAITMPVFFDAVKFVNIPSKFSDLLVVLSLLFTTFIGCSLYYFYENPISKYLK